MKIGLKLLFIFIFLYPSVLLAENRVALVIGNDTYAEVQSLEKARNDARAIAASLSKNSGFEVTLVLDANRRQMNRKIANFVDRLQSGDTALFYFAGHGVEIDGQNFLLPVDIPVDDSADLLKSEAIELSRLLNRVRNSGARLTLAIIDACRNNPFEAQGKRSIGGSRGLALMSAPAGTFVMFSAGAGQAALDRLSGNDPNPNSVFTRSLLPLIAVPGKSVRDVAVELRREVYKISGSVNHVQTPAYYDELLGEFEFIPVAMTERQTESTPNKLRRDFERAEAMDTIAAWNAFLSIHASRQDDFLFALAKERLIALSVPDDESAAALEEPSLGENIPALENGPTAAKLEAVKPEPTESPTLPAVFAPDQKIAPMPKLPVFAFANPSIRGPVAPELSGRSLARAVQVELARIGCNPGTIDGVWGSNSNRAIQLYAQKKPVESTEPSMALLAQLKVESERVCSLECNAQQVQRNGECVTKNCPFDQISSSTGLCVVRTMKCFTFDGQRVCN